MMVEMVGWTANFLLAICAIPQAYKSIKDGHADGVAAWQLIFWSAGEVIGLIYIIMKSNEVDLTPIIFNYACNCVALSVIIYYKVKKKENILDK